MYQSSVIWSQHQKIAIFQTFAQKVDVHSPEVFDPFFLFVLKKNYWVFWWKEGLQYKALGIPWHKQTQQNRTNKVLAIQNNVKPKLLMSLKWKEEGRIRNNGTMIPLLKVLLREKMYWTGSAQSSNINSSSFTTNLSITKDWYEIPDIIVRHLSCPVPTRRARFYQT